MHNRKYMQSAHYMYFCYRMPFLYKCPLMSALRKMCVYTKCVYWGKVYNLCFGSYIILGSTDWICCVKTQT